mgnify:CR=1 FL=1
MARKEQLTFLGSLPVDTDLVTLLDAAETDEKEPTPEDGAMEQSFPLLERYNKTSTSKLFQPIAGKVIDHLSSP